MPSLKEMHLDLELVFFAGGTSPVLAVVLHDGLAPAVADLLYLADRIDIPHTGETDEDDKLTTSPAQEALGSSRTPSPRPSPAGRGAGDEGSPANDVAMLFDRWSRCCDFPSGEPA